MLESLLFLLSPFYCVCAVVDGSLADGACLAQGDCDAIQSGSLLQIDNKVAVVAQSQSSQQSQQTLQSRRRAGPRRRSTPKPSGDDIAKVISQASVKDIAMVIANFSGSKGNSPGPVTDIGQELEPLKEALGSISKKVAGVADDIDELKKGAESEKEMHKDLMAAVDKISKELQPLKDGLEGLKKVEGIADDVNDLKKEVKESRDSSKSFLNSIGKIVTTNKKYLKAIYNDLHGSR